MGLLNSRGSSSVSSSKSSGSSSSSTKKTTSSSSSGGGLLKPREQSGGTSSSTGKTTSSTNKTTTGANKTSSGSGSGNSSWDSSQGLLRPRETASSSASSGSSGSSGGKGTVTQAPGANVPRYAPSANQKLQDNLGGKLGADGVLRYPEGVYVDPERYARTQAAMDYSYGASGKPRDGMDSAYYTEYKRLANVRPGEGTYIDTGGKAPGGTGGNAGAVVPDRPGGSYPGLSYPDLSYPDLSYPGAPDWTVKPGVDIPDISLDDVLGKDYLKEYEEALRAAEEAAARALAEKTDAAVKNINDQKNPLLDQYNKSAQQAYIVKRQAEKSLPQQLAAQGLTGGATESANLALETGYGNNLGELTSGYNSGLAAIDRDAANVKATGDLSLAENTGKYKQQFADAALKNGQYARDLQAQLLMNRLNAQNQSDSQRRQLEAQLRLAQQQLKGQLDLSKYKTDLSYDDWLKKQDAQRLGGIWPYMEL